MQLALLTPPFYPLSHLSENGSDVLLLVRQSKGTAIAWSFTFYLLFRSSALSVSLSPPFPVEIPRRRRFLILFLVEITAAGTAHGTGRYAQFVVGRIIVYISVGLVEVDVT